MRQAGSSSRECAEYTPVQMEIPEIRSSNSSSEIDRLSHVFYVQCFQIAPDFTFTEFHHLAHFVHKSLLQKKIFRGLK